MSYRIRLFIMCAFLTILFSLSLNAENDTLTADEIIDEMTETMNPQQSKGTAKMTIITTTGQERTFVYESYSKNQGEKTLMKYKEPARVRGQATLMLNNANDIWVYFPRTGRVRKLATHARRQKVQGSDFSYEDMGASDAFIDDYTSVRLEDENKDERPCYKLELTRKPDSEAGYSRIILWVDKEYLVPQEVHYYHDEDPNLWQKQLVCEEIKKVDGIYTPMKMIMYSKLDNTRTVMEFVDINYDVNLPDNLFTEMGMKR